MSHEPSPCPACREPWVSADGEFAVCRDCPYRIAPVATGGNGCCVAEALVRAMLELTAEVNELKAARAADAKLWAETVFSKEAGR
ncbi:hypothetical protein [Nitratireductor alexandrii]|uniref:hypothetical protein n=1 Tax=Nitratireductor alexandrii TaxID=2448161 RepID=UPI000FD845D1|nr:hypothetical protein [Nitratireductor alexandrii]